MLPRFLSQMPLVEEEEVEEVQPLQYQQKSLPAIAPTDFIEPIVAGSMLAEVEQELEALLEETRTSEKEVKELCSCRSVESLSSSYRDSSNASSSSSDNGEDIESNTEEVPIEDETETISEVKSVPAVVVPERPRSCPPMGISQKYSIREIRDPRQQAVKRWTQQSQSLAMAEEPSTSSDSESHSEEGDYDYERSPPLSPISSAHESEGEWAGETLDKMPTVTLEEVTETEVEPEVSKNELVLPAPLESQVPSVSTEWPTVTETSKELISAEAFANYNPFMSSFVMTEELPMFAPVELKEMETEKVDITVPEAVKEIETEKVEITIPEAIKEVEIAIPEVIKEIETEKIEIVVLEAAKETEIETVVIPVPEVVKAKVVQVQRKKTQKRKLPMKQRLRNAKKRSSRKNQ